MIERLLSPHRERCIICQRDDCPYAIERDGSEQDCGRCGRFRITGTAIGVLRYLDDMPARTRLSRYVRRQNDSLQVVPRITDQDVQAVRAAKNPSIEERANSLFAYLVATTGKLGEQHEITDPALDGAAGSLIGDEHGGGFCGAETEWLLKMLEGRGWLPDEDGDYEITPEGFAAWERAARDRMGQRVGFIAMAFGQPRSEDIRRGARAAIESAGYEPFVVSDAEHIGRIDDVIVSGLRTARFLVADLTHHRQNVYWEAGFCLGLDTPVFLTCQQDHVAAIHFDIRQYNAVVWVDVGDLAAKLQRRIEAVIGRGPV